MPMNPAIKIALILGTIIILMGSTYVIHRKTDTQVVFQPEANMLTQALDVGETSRESTTLSNISDHPVNATTTQYVYDTTMCRTSSSYICLAGVYKNLVINFGASTAITDLKKRSGENGTVNAECHPLMHVIGRQ